MSEQRTAKELDHGGRRRRFADERAQMARRTIPELISLLESEELRTRFLAEMCLRDAAGT
jgi:hypothetical protein